MQKRSLLWSDARIKPPFGSAVIDWHHPLARGLSNCFVLNEGGGPVLINWVRPTTAQSNTEADWVASAMGVAMNYPNTASSSDLGYRGIAGDLTNDFSVFYRAYAAPNSAYHTAGLCGGGALEEQSAFHWGMSDSNQFNFTLTGIVDIPFTSLTVTAGWYDVVIAYTRVTQARANIYPLGGATTRQTVAETSTPSTNVAHAYLGNDAGATTGWGAALALTYVWRRALSDEEADWLHAEPYAMFRSIGMRRLFAGAVSPVRSSLLLLGAG